MSDWKSIVEQKLKKQKNKVSIIGLDKASVKYSEKVKQNRTLKALTGDEEIVRAFLIDRLVNELDYKPENIEIEKEYSVKAGHTELLPRIDLIVKDDEGNPFMFIEAKAPNKYEKDKSEIEGQLFSLAHAEEKDFKTKVKYLVYYTADYQDEELLDKAIIIDFDKYNNYTDWESDGFISISSELTAGYGKPKKQPLIKGHEKHDLRTRIDRDEIQGLGKNLHNVLWGGGGTNDSEIFYSLVNIILAKLQDEYEKEDNQEYDFQIHQYGDQVESSEKVYNRINALYKRALKQQLNISEQQKIDDDNVINRNKFPLNKLLYTTQSLENFSFLRGRNSLDGKDILGDFFESITRDGFKQTKGQFFTPTPIVNFLLYSLQLDKLSLNKLNKDRELPLIIDPSAGSGTYLVEAMKLVTKELKYKQKDKIKSSDQVQDRFDELFMPNKSENKWAREYLYGSEINFDLGTASKVNMILHGDGSTNIFVKDGLLPFRFYVKPKAPNYLETSSPDPLYSDKEVNGKFDVVISNPPFNVDLDKQTQREIKNAFLFGDKKNSENLFIERYYQLLKEGGRLGVVLPESVFDTSDNKYIRLFLFKYFNVKAVVSLPEVTFEPFTSTKTSLLFAQKKTKAQINEWNDLWDSYGKEWSRLRTRVLRYHDYFIENAKLSKKYVWVKELESDINEALEKEYKKAADVISNDDIKNIKANVIRFLKDYITSDDKNLEAIELLKKYSREIKEIARFDKESNIFGFYNSWWVFGEVASKLDYSIFMAEAKNVGYKRTKRGENKMPNDLFDIEYAPKTINKEKILSKVEENILHNSEQQKELKVLHEEAKEALKKRNTDTNKKKEEKLSEQITELKKAADALKIEKRKIEGVFEKYYDNNELKSDYAERVDKKLIEYFDKGVLSQYRSEDIVLREDVDIKILDKIRKGVVWE